MTAIIIPVKQLNLSKTRMSSIMNLDERKSLVLTMLIDVLNTLKKIQHINRYIIGADKEIKDLAELYNFTFINEEKSIGLNQAVFTGIKLISDMNDDSVLIMHADIPLIEIEDIYEIINLKNSYDVIISPSKDMYGTNALFLCPPQVIEPKFGPGSFQNHLDEANLRKLKIKILKNNRIAFDIDTIDDLRKLSKIDQDRYVHKFILEKRILNRL